MTYDCPVAACDGHDFPRLIDKRVPAVAAVVDDVVEMELHGFAVASRQHEGGASPAFGADRTEQVGRFGPLIVRGAGTGALPGPAIGELVLLADPHLVLAPHLYRCARRKLRADLRHTAGKVFWNVSTASASCL